MPAALRAPAAAPRAPPPPGPGEGPPIPGVSRHAERRGAQRHGRVTRAEWLAVVLAITGGGSWRPRGQVPLDGVEVHRVRVERPAPAAPLTMDVLWQPRDAVVLTVLPRRPVDRLRAARRAEGRHPRRAPGDEDDGDQDEEA